MNEFLLPLNLPGLSKEIAAANEAAHKAAEEAHAANAAVEQAHRAVPLAHEADKASAALAVAEGKAPPELTEPAAKAAAAEADRLSQAKQRFARQQSKALVGAVLADFDNYIAARTAAAEEAAPGLRDAVPGLIEKLGAYEYEVALVRVARETKASVRPIAGPVSPAHDPDVLQRSYARQLEQQRERRRNKSMSANAPVERELGALLAAVQLEVEHSMAEVKGELEPNTRAVHLKPGDVRRTRRKVRRTREAG